MTTSVLAQVPTGPPAHAVPFGATGNAIELELAGPDGVGLSEAGAAVVSAPLWIRFHGGASNVGGDPTHVVRLAFDVDRSAPVGEPAEVTLEVRLAGVVAATHTVRLVVSPPPLALESPYPNPARAAVTVPFTVPASGPVRLVVYDALGREVAVLVDGYRAAGAHEGRLAPGALASGVYVVRLVAAGESGPEFRARTLTVVR